MNTTRRFRLPSAFALVAALGLVLTGCASAPDKREAPRRATTQPAPAPVAIWPVWNPAPEPPATNRFVLPPPFLQLPEQKAAREEVERSGVSPALVQKTLAGQSLALAEIAELSRHKVSDANVVKYLRSTGAVYALTTKEVNELQAAQVNEAVIDYLLSTPRLLGGSVWIYPTLYPTPLYWPRYGHGSYFDLHHGWPALHHDYGHWPGHHH